MPTDSAIPRLALIPRLVAAFALAALCGFTAAEAAPRHFPLPEAIKPDVAFWQRIYSEVGNEYGLMHDSRDLSIVYAKVSMPERISNKTRRRLVRQEIKAIRAVLYRVAGRPAARLQGEDRRIRKLFPAAASAAEIKAAARRIRFQRGQKDRFTEAIRRSGYYMDFIRAELKKHHMPPELAALPFVESSFNTRARSFVGASGIWQFMPGTGRRFMQVNHVFDERNDPFRATLAAINLLQYDYGILGSWPLAITAYNHGVSGMRRAVRKTGSRDIGVIVKRYRSRTFGFASRNFYAEFLAALHVWHHAGQYFPGVVPYPPVRYAEFELADYIPARVVAEALGVSLREFREHNLGLRAPIWEGDKHLPRGYLLRVPARSARGEVKQLLAAIPDSKRFARQKPDRKYRVRRGDSLSGIAAMFGFSVNQLVVANNLRNRHLIYPGQIVYLPRGGRSRRAAKPKPKAATAALPSLIATAAAEPAAPAPRQQQAQTAPPTHAPTAPAAAVLVEGEIADSLEQLAATDPAEYAVARDNTIEIQAAETLGHYADWLQVDINRLRAINRLNRRGRLIIGARLLLDFSRVGPREFEGKRADYHKRLEDAFFARQRIAGTRNYRVRRGDTLWKIAHRRGRMPLWLVRQHNPDVNFTALKVGSRIVLPILERKDKTG